VLRCGLVCGWYFEVFGNVLKKLKAKVYTGNIYMFPWAGQKWELQRRHGLCRHFLRKQDYDFIEGHLGEYLAQRCHLGHDVRQQSLVSRGDTGSNTSRTSATLSNLSLNLRNEARALGCGAPVPTAFQSGQARSLCMNMLQARCRSSR
jgi:hypothetical protein